MILKKSLMNPAAILMASSLASHSCAAIILFSTKRRLNRILTGIPVKSIHKKYD